MIKYDTIQHKKQLKRKCELLIQSVNKNFISAKEYKDQLCDLLLQDNINFINILYDEIFHNKICNNISITLNKIQELITEKAKELFSFYYDRFNDATMGGVVYQYEVFENDKTNFENLLNNQLKQEIMRISIKYNEYCQQKNR